MTSTVTQKLADLVDTIEALPAQAQADVLAEIESRIESLKQSSLTDEQRAVVKARLAAHRQYAGRDDVLALLRRFNPAL